MNTCPFPYGTTEYYQWWDEEHKRTIQELQIQWAADDKLRKHLEAILYHHTFDENRACSKCRVSERIFHLLSGDQKWIHRAVITCPTSHERIAILLKEILG